MPIKNAPEKIDEAASKAKRVSMRAGNAVKGGARKVARKIKRAGKAAGKKMGA